MIDLFVIALTIVLIILAGLKGLESEDYFY